MAVTRDAGHAGAPEKAIEGRTLTIAQALNLALHQEMERDPSVVVIGEDVGVAGGVFGVTKGLLEKFGPRRVLDTPISEAGFTGLAVGAAMTGLKPVVDLMFNDFATMAMDEIVNQAAHLRYMTGGQAALSLVIRTLIGGGRSFGTQHSQSLHAWFAHIPGLKVAMPATPADAYGLLLTAIRDPNQVVFVEDKVEYGRKGPVTPDGVGIPFGRAAIHRVGSDVTIVATSSMVHLALAAADALVSHGVQPEVVDPRTLVPLDREAIVASARRTHAAVVVDEGYRSYGVTAEIAALISEALHAELRRPVRRVGARDVPIPYSPALEKRVYPSVEDVVEAALAVAR